MDPSFEELLQARRDSLAARSVAQIVRRRAADDAVRLRIVARFADRESTASRQWRLALNEGR